MESVVGNVTGTKEEMETCLGLLLDLASDMAEPGQNHNLSRTAMFAATCGALPWLGHASLE